MPRVSVLIPTYNYAHYLPEAIELVLAQDFTDFELIIRDDASTDDSAAVIRRYSQRDPRIRAELLTRNEGMVANWNACLRAATGDYVKFIFGDDRLTTPQALGGYVALLDAHPEALIGASAREIFDAHSRPTAIWNDLRDPGLHDGRQVIAQCLRTDRNLIGEPTAVILRRAACARGFDPSYRQVVDLEFWLHLLKSGDLAYAPFPWCSFRVHQAQQTAVNRQQALGPLESIRLLLSYIDYLPCAQAVSRRRLPSIQHTLFRTLYYSRKDNPRSPEMLALETALRARLGTAGYAQQWLRHRATRPWINLHRKWRKLRGQPTTEPGPTALPSIKSRP